MEPPGQFIENKEWPLLSQQSAWSSRGHMFVRVKKWTETRQRQPTSGSTESHSDWIR